MSKKKKCEVCMRSCAQDEIQTCVKCARYFCPECNSINEEYCEECL